MGRSGRLMLDALSAGDHRPRGAGRVGARAAAREDPHSAAGAAGAVSAPHAFLIGQILAKIDFLEEAIGTLSEAIDRQVRPFEPVIAGLMTIPG